MTIPKNPIWCVIPVFNHSKTLRDVVEKTLRHCPNVIVVDDGSTDADIPDLLDNLKIEIATHENNLGKGAAIKTGAEIAAKKNADFIITLDADGQHDPADIDKFIPLLEKEKPKVLVGARNFQSSNIPDRSKFGREFSNFWIHLETGLDIRDTQSGFRAYPVELPLDKSISAKHYAFETEILVRAAWRGFDIVNVDISVFYPERGERVSHFKLFRDNLRISLLHAKLTTERLLRGKQAANHDTNNNAGKTEISKTILASASDAPEKTAEALESKQAVALIPTETVYGLACEWNDSNAIGKIKEMKGRTEEKPLQMLAESIDMAEKNGVELNNRQRRLVEKLTPGPITFVAKHKNIADSSIGFRIPDNDLVRKTIAILATPLAATSANKTGQLPATTVENALESLYSHPDIVVDAGIIQGQPSTVVDIRGNSPLILRKGPVSLKEIEKHWSESEK